MKTLLLLLAILLTQLLTSNTFAQPDLVISYDDLNKSSATVGELVRATWKTKNRGDSESQSCRTSLWLSKDKFWDESDIYLNSGGTTSLNPNEYDEDSRSFIIPMVESGSYYVVYFADFAEDHTSLVEESNESNNTNWDGLTVNNPFTDVKEEILSKEFTLEQNYPNPFNPSTVIRYALPVTGFAEIKVYNAVGELVKVLVSGEMPAGQHTVSFDATGLPSGLYLYRLETEGSALTRKMLLVK